MELGDNDEETYTNFDIHSCSLSQDEDIVADNIKTIVPHKVIVSTPLFHLSLFHLLLNILHRNLSHHKGLPLSNPLKRRHVICTSLSIHLMWTQMSTLMRHNTFKYIHQNLIHTSKLLFYQISKLIFLLPHQNHIHKLRQFKPPLYYMFPNF